MRCAVTLLPRYLAALCLPSTTSPTTVSTTEAGDTDSLAATCCMTSWRVGQHTLENGHWMPPKFFYLGLNQTSTKA